MLSGISFLKPIVDKGKKKKRRLTRIALHPRDSYPALEDPKEMISQLIDQGYEILRDRDLIHRLEMLLNIFLLFMCDKSIVHLIIDLNSGILRATWERGWVRYPSLNRQISCTFIVDDKLSAVLVSYNYEPELCSAIIQSNNFCSTSRWANHYFIVTCNC